METSPSFHWFPTVGIFYKQGKKNTFFCHGTCPSFLWFPTVSGSFTSRARRTHSSAMETCPSFLRFPTVSGSFTCRAQRTKVQHVLLPSSEGLGAQSSLPAEPEDKVKSWLNWTHDPLCENHGWRSAWQTLGHFTNNDQENLPSAHFSLLSTITHIHLLCVLCLHTISLSSLLPESLGCLTW